MWLFFKRTRGRRVNLSKDRWGLNSGLSELQEIPPLLWLFAVSDPKLSPFSFKVVGWITRLRSSTENFCSWPKIGAEGDKLAEQLPQSVWGWAVSDFR